MITTHLGVAHPWFCDSMGHMNTRNYVGMFDDASAHFLSALGWRSGGNRSPAFGWADVRGEIEYEKEVPCGALVRIQTKLESIGTKSLTIFSEMRANATGDLCSTMRSVIVHFDLAERRAINIPSEIRQKATSITQASVQAEIVE